MNLNEISKIEKQFCVNYPEIDNATYHSILNFSDDINEPFQRWYRYKEGYSTKLVKNIINNEKEPKIILDPFMGSGTTLLAAKELGIKSIGFEVNPFSYFLTQCKLNNYTKSEISKFKLYKDDIINKINNISNYCYKLPELSISNKVFSKNIEKKIVPLFDIIKKYKKEKKVYDLLKLGLLSIIEDASNYRKAGNGLKIRRNTKKKSLSVVDLKERLNNVYNAIYDDISKKRLSVGAKLYNESCLKMKSKIKEQSIDGIIFSPPYANCFDYTEIYKLELWFGEFVNSYDDLKVLRNKSIHSHLNCKEKVDNLITTEFLQYLLDNVEENKLWDKKIPEMLKHYYSDMFNILILCNKVLKKGGFCNIIIGNSAYGNIVFPSDLLFSDFAISNGFVVEKIDVNRFIIPSSQQYHALISFKKYLRESIVCLRKI